MEENAKTILRQAEDVTLQIADADAENRALLTEHTQIKAQIERYTDSKGAIDVSEIHLNILSYFILTRPSPLRRHAS